MISGGAEAKTEVTHIAMTAMKQWGEWNPAHEIP